MNALENHTALQGEMNVVLVASMTKDATLVRLENMILMPIPVKKKPVIHVQKIPIGPEKRMQKMKTMRNAVITKSMFACRVLLAWKQMPREVSVLKVVIALLPTHVGMIINRNV